MLILVYGVDENGAFEMLRWRSQSTNTKLRTLAGQLVADYRVLCNGEALPSRAVYDMALKSVHERIAGN
jgi:ANTAR domain